MTVDSTDKQTSDTANFVRSTIACAHPDVDDALIHAFNSHAAAAEATVRAQACVLDAFASFRATLATSAPSPAPAEATGGDAVVSEAAVIESPGPPSSKSSEKPPLPTVNVQRPAVSSNQGGAAVAKKPQPRKVILQNGTAGREYATRLAIQVEGLGDVDVLTVDGLGAAGGLNFDPDTQTVSGIPENAGEYQLKLDLRGREAKGGSTPSTFTRDAQLLINPNPRSLWKDLPSDKSDPYWKADSASARIDDGPQLLVAASKRGRSHANEGKFRDDDFLLKYDAATAWYLFVVADGAGSAKYSRRASQLVCESVGESVGTAFGTKLGEEFSALVAQHVADPTERSKAAITKVLYETLGSAAFGALKRIETEAAEKTGALRDFATTLVLGISKKFDAGHFIAGFWIGDGGIGVLDLAGRRVEVLGESDSGEFAGQTRFLLPQEFESYDKVVSRLRFGVWDQYTAVVAMTDGISDPKFETDNNINDFEKWRAFWEDDLCQSVSLVQDNAKVEEELLTWLDFWSPGNHDDRTLAILLGKD